MKVILLSDDAGNVIQSTLNELNQHIGEWLDPKKAKEMYDNNIEFVNEFHDIDWYVEEIPKCKDDDRRPRS